MGTGHLIRMDFLRGLGWQGADAANAGPDGAGPARAEVLDASHLDLQHDGVSSV